MKYENVLRQSRVSASASGPAQAEATDVMGQSLGGWDAPAKYILPPPSGSKRVCRFYWSQALVTNGLSPGRGAAPGREKIPAADEPAWRSVLRGAARALGLHHCATPGLLTSSLVLITVRSQCPARPRLRLQAPLPCVFIHRELTNEPLSLPTLWPHQHSFYNSDWHTEKDRKAFPLLRRKYQEIVC